MILLRERLALSPTGPGPATSPVPHTAQPALHSLPQQGEHAPLSEKVPTWAGVQDAGGEKSESLCAGGPCTYAGRSTNIPAGPLGHSTGREAGLQPHWLDFYLRQLLHFKNNVKVKKVAITRTRLHDGRGLCGGQGVGATLVGAHLVQDSGRPRESHIVSPCPRPRPPFSLSTALSPEEAESALEAAHYFTEDGSSEGERCGDRWPAALRGGEPALLGCSRTGALPLSGQIPGVFSLISLVSAFLGL